MAATTLTAASTQQKLLRARTASAQLALLSAKEKNELLLAISDALEANEKSILEANHADMENSDLEGAMRVDQRLAGLLLLLRHLGRGATPAAGPCPPARAPRCGPLSS